MEQSVLAVLAPSFDISVTIKCIGFAEVAGRICPGEGKKGLIGQDFERLGETQ